MTFLWSKIARIYLNDWKNHNSISFKQFAMLERKLVVRSWAELVNLKRFLSFNLGLSGVLYFLQSEKICSLATILEIAILNDEWNLVIKLTESEDIQFCYLGHKTKYHIHEMIFSRVLDLIREDKFQPEDFYKLISLKIKRQYIGKSLFYRLKHSISEEIKNCQTKNSVAAYSPLLEKLIEFSLFLKDNELLIEDFFSITIKDAIKYRNLEVLIRLNAYLPDECPWLLVNTLNLSFIDASYKTFPALFKKQNYLPYIVKQYFETALADETSLYEIINWLKQKDLDWFAPDHTLLPLIISSPFHSYSKVPLVNQLMADKVIPKNRFLIENLRNLPKIHPFLFEALAAGTDIPEITKSITGCKSFKKIGLVSDLLGSLSLENSQNKLLFMYLSINKVGINRDRVLNSSAVPNLRTLSPVTLNQLIFVLSFYKAERQLKLITSITPSHDRDIQSSFEILSILKNSNWQSLKIPLKPNTLSELSAGLIPIQKIIQDANVSLGLDYYAKELEKINFRDFKIKVPRTAQELRQVGLKFKNCLAQDRHSRFVSDIILKSIIVFTIENEKESYCISIDPHSREIIEAKSQGQDPMPHSLTIALQFFMREIDFGYKWF